MTPDDERLVPHIEVDDRTSAAAAGGRALRERLTPETTVVGFEVSNGGVPWAAIGCAGVVLSPPTTTDPEFVDVACGHDPCVTPTRLVLLSGVGAEVVVPERLWGRNLRLLVDEHGPPLVVDGDVLVSCEGRPDRQIGVGHHTHIRSDGAGGMWVGVDELGTSQRVDPLAAQGLVRMSPTGELLGTISGPRGATDYHETHALTVLEDGTVWVFYRGRWGRMARISPAGVVISERSGGLGVRGIAAAAGRTMWFSGSRHSGPNGELSLIRLHLAELRPDGSSRTIGSGPGFDLMDFKGVGSVFADGVTFVTAAGGGIHLVQPDGAWLVCSIVDVRGDATTGGPGTAHAQS